MVQSPETPGATCRLLHLPRELRDMIYEYALSEPEGLFYRYKKFDNTCKLYPSLAAACSDSGIPLESNQLKYVCQQLHSETAGFGLKFNDLNIVRYDLSHPVPSLQLLNFLGHCSEKSLNKLRKIEVRTLPYPIEEGEETVSVQSARMHQVINFCRSHPKTTVNIRMRTASRIKNMPEESLLYTAACLMQASYREIDMSHLLVHPAIRRFIEANADINRANGTVKAFEIPNLRFWPPYTTFDENEFRKRAQKSVLLKGWIIPYFPHGLDGLVAEIRGWHRNGF